MSGSALEVDLDRLADNLRRVHEAVSPAEVMLVVKNDAYGHGLDAVVARARREGVGWFGAFDVITGARVRDLVGPEPRVFIWTAENEAQASLAVDLDIDIGVGDLRLFTALTGIRGGRTARVHLKIDTGLRRNGVRPEDWSDLVARAVAAEDAGVLSVEGIWSHIAEASDDEDDRARARFERALAIAADAGLRPRWRHLSASAASFARPEFRYDLVRVGAFAYGIRPAGGPEEAALGVRPVARWTAPVTEVGADTVRIGVGSRDGLFSTLVGCTVGTPAGPRRVTAITGSRVEVTRWDGAAVGDRVTVFGAAEDGATATSLAESIGTIGEEIAVRVSPLVPRRYRGMR
ncbi:alanine racemase [Microbacterium invictum]|uniref:Alanine racemase n=1 Tax=Microbacterium invictum TaxID=515415 RepID=A0ABZ0V636_9MICO|nr:alanine racemase [Microbacterium invictum]WQB69053.1 alanine racemase [Microbacterium invictum]